MTMSSSLLASLLMSENGMGTSTSLISNDASKDELIVMPAYWFLHNMYALARNSWKYPDRDKRIEKTQTLEFDFLAPDTIGEMLGALTLLKRFTGRAALLTGKAATRLS